jgi:hypothetical protein
MHETSVPAARNASNGYAGSGLQPRSILSQQIVAPGLVILRIGTMSWISPRAPSAIIGD